MYNPSPRWLKLRGFANSFPPIAHITKQQTCLFLMQL